MTKITWPRRDSILALHDEAIAEFGGQPGVLNAGSLESALARPQNLYAYNSDVSIFELAASLAYGLIKNHAFLDGNKRTALLATGVFLARNGYILAPDQKDAVETIVAVAEGSINEEALATWLKTFSRAR
ncbi:MAG: type II toxin-antitoxin system death-on-curing family toxin [Alphaproteobacteria bacterium]